MRSSIMWIFALTCLSQSLHALTCDSGEISDYKEKGRIHTVTSNVTCRIDAADLDDFGDKVLAKFSTLGEISSEDRRDNGIEFLFAEKEIDTGHGKVQISYAVSASCRRPGSCHIVSDSRTIDATGFAAATREVLVIASFIENNSGISLHIAKVTKLKKPRLAPGFRKIVRKKLTEDIHHLGITYASLVD